MELRNVFDDQGEEYIYIQTFHAAMDDEVAMGGGRGGGFKGFSC